MGAFPTLDVRRIARFRLGSHNLAVELGRRERVAWEARVCKRCSESRLRRLLVPVDDEFHLLFRCRTTATLRASLPRSLRRATNVREFLDGDDFRTIYSYVSNCMKLVDEGGGQNPT